LDWEKVLVHFLHRDLKVGIRGWLSTARQALFLSSAECARRVGVSRSTWTQFEKSELRGTIQIQHLARLAEALDCELVHAKADLNFFSLVHQEAPLMGCFWQRVFVIFHEFKPFAELFSHFLDFVIDVWAL